MLNDLGLLHQKEGCGSQGDHLEDRQVQWVEDLRDPWEALVQWVCRLVQWVHHQEDLIQIVLISEEVLQTKTRVTEISGEIEIETNQMIDTEAETEDGTETGAIETVAVMMTGGIEIETVTGTGDATVTAEVVGTGEGLATGTETVETGNEIGTEIGIGIGTTRGIVTGTGGPVIETEADVIGTEVNVETEEIENLGGAK